MKRYRQVDDTIISLTKGTNQNRVFRLRKSCIFVPFVRRNNRIFRLWKSCIFVPFVRRQVDGTIISRTKVAKLFIYARMARMRRYRQVDCTILLRANGTNIKSCLPLAEIVLFVPFVRRKSCLFVSFVRREIVLSACGNRDYSKACFIGFGLIPLWNFYINRLES